MSSLEIPDVEPDVAAILAVRAYCGWHVAPEVTEELTLDGPSPRGSGYACGGSDLLVIPTLRVVGISEIIECGTVLDLDTLNWSTLGLVRKNPGCWWTHKYGAITVTLTHGFEDPQDFWSAVASYRDRTVDGGLSGGGREAVGPFVFGSDTAEYYCQFSTAEKAILDRYRLEYSA